METYNAIFKNRPLKLSTDLECSEVKKNNFSKEFFSSNCLTGPAEWSHENLVKKIARWPEKLGLMSKNDERFHFFSKIKYLPDYQYKQFNS